MAEPSDDELTQEVKAVLSSTWDLSTVTLDSVRRAIETKLACDLEGRKDVLNASLREYIKEMGDDDEDDFAPSAAGAGPAGTVQADDDEDEELVEIKGGKKRKKNGGGGGGMNSSMVLAPELAEVVGLTEAGRMTVVKNLWIYIRANNLQNPKDKRKIMCDEKLQKVFKAKTVNMFSMNKLLGRKMWKKGDLESQDRHDEDEAEDDEDEEDDDEEDRAVKKVKVGKPVKKTKPTKKSKSKKSEDGEDKPKRKQKEFRLSTSMSCALGVDKASRPELVKLLWAYIRTHALQNPQDKREILLDGPLQSAFGVKSFTMFSMNKFLSDHLLPLDDDDAGSGVVADEDAEE
jgi:upstream activation factor subunit UAF30